MQAVLHNESARNMERLEALGEVVPRCPFGCTVQDMDEYGYCTHLIGFTNDGKTVERVSAVKMNGTDTGRKQVLRGDKDTVQRTDVLVNPETTQRGEDGIDRLVKSSVSSRVYRKEPLKADK